MPLETKRLEHDEASTAKLFEEIKVMFQDLPSRIDVAAEHVRGPRGMRRFHPAMIDELVHMIGRGDGGPGVAALIAASFVRDDLPWLYEMGVEVYRQSLSAEPAVVTRAYRNFMQAAETTTMGAFAREMRSSHDLRMILEEIPMLLRHFEISEKPDEEEPA